MGYVTVIVSFIVCIFFNIFLNSFDVYSDTSLAYNTLKYNLGDSLLLSGCRVCHGKEDEAVFRRSNFICKPCLVNNSRFHCGRSFEILNEIVEIQNKDTCENEHFFSNYNYTTNKYGFGNNKCNTDTDECCLESINDTIHSSAIANNIDHVDKRILAYHVNHLDERILAHHFHHVNQTHQHLIDRDKVPYEIYVLSGNFGNYYCHGVFWDYFNSSVEQFLYFLNTNVTIKMGQNKNEARFKFINGANDTILREDGFGYADQCGILIQHKQKTFVQNSGESCGSDACLVHLQRLKYKLSISNLTYWRQETFYKHGIKLGGKTCELLWKYGLASLVPILINMTFNVLVFLEDIKVGKTSRIEFIFVLALFYPQWKTIRFLAEYVYRRNEDQLNEAKQKFDNQVGALEPFLESAFQVSL